MRRNARYAEPASSAHVLARRLVNIFAHGKLVLSNSDMLWRSKVFVSLREQSRLLARIAGEAPDGLPRFEAAAGVVLSGACLGDARRLEAGSSGSRRRSRARSCPMAAMSGARPRRWCTSIASPPW